MHWNFFPAMRRVTAWFGYNLNFLCFMVDKLAIIQIDLVFREIFTYFPLVIYKYETLNSSNESKFMQKKRHIGLHRFWSAEILKNVWKMKFRKN